MSRRQALLRLLQVVAGTVGLGSLGGCPGGSTYGRTMAEAEQNAELAPQIGRINSAGNLVLSAADMPEAGPLELTIAGKQAYLYREQVDGTTVWYAVSRVCTHLKCKVNFKAEKQEYVCPCHRSRFALDGTVLKPPAKRDLQSWAVADLGGTIEIILAEQDTEDSAEQKS